MNSQINLLSIPRELRDEIITFVLTYCHPTPQTPAEVEAQARVQGQKRWGESGYYLEDLSAYTANTAGLLLANRQLRSETQEVLDRLNLAHEADVKFVNERYLAPTWTLIPTKTRHFERIRAVFQSIGAWQQPMLESKYQGANPWIYGDGGRPAYVWIFYNTFVNFLNHGVAAPYASSVPNVISVERLEIEFIDPKEVGLFPQERVRSLWDARGPHVVMSPGPKGPELLRPEWLAEALAGEMRSMFRMSYHVTEYARMFHGRIGYMIFKVNGKIIDEIDVGQILADLKFSDSFSFAQRDSLESWVHWKEEAQELRRKRGLKTVEFKKGWQEDDRVAAAEFDASHS